MDQPTSKRLHEKRTGIGRNAALLGVGPRHHGEEAALGLDRGIHHLPSPRITCHYLLINRHQIIISQINHHRLPPRIISKKPTQIKECSNKNRCWAWARVATESRWRSILTVLHTKHHHYASLLLTSSCLLLLPSFLLLLPLLPSSLLPLLLDPGWESPYINTGRKEEK